MKRSLLILLCLLLILPGCQQAGEKETVTFYYLLNDYQFAAEEESVIASETRESSGYKENLSYQLALYLMGPLEDNLRSPLPSGVRMISAEVRDGQVYLTLSDVSGAMSDAGFTLACACLTLTCLELTEAENVTIISGSKTVTMNRSSLLLFDSGNAAQKEEPK